MQMLNSLKEFSFLYFSVIYLAIANEATLVLTKHLHSSLLGENYVEKPGRNIGICILVCVVAIFFQVTEWFP